MDDKYPRMESLAMKLPIHSGLIELAVMKYMHGSIGCCLCRTSMEEPSLLLKQHHEVYPRVMPAVNAIYTALRARTT